MIACTVWQGNTFCVPYSLTRPRPVPGNGRILAAADTVFLLPKPVPSGANGNVKEDILRFSRSEFLSSFAGARLLIILPNNWLLTFEFNFAVALKKIDKTIWERNFEDSVCLASWKNIRDSSKITDHMRWTQIWKR